MTTTDAGTHQISPAALADAIEHGESVPILDVRDRDELESWRIEGLDVDLTHVPHAKFVSAQVTGDAADLVEPERDRDYVVVCPRGEASDEVAGTLREAGVDAVNLEGGMDAWARLYRESEITVDADGLDAIQLRRPASGCLAYALVAKHEALVVDPLRAFTDRYETVVAERGASIEYVLDTHVHADHVSGLRDLANTTDATPLLSDRAADRGVTFDVETVADGDTIDVGDTTVDGDGATVDGGDATVEVIATPGHTTGSISLRCENLLLTGDSLFLDGVPRPDLEADAEGVAEHARELYATVTDRLANIPDPVLVAPGHYVPGTVLGEDGTYTATLGSLREGLSTFDESAEEFVSLILDSMGERPANFERIVDANLGRTSVDEEVAFAMELGPNNCAVRE